MILVSAGLLVIKVVHYPCGPNLIVMRLSSGGLCQIHLQLCWYHTTPLDQHLIMVKIFHIPHSAKKLIQISPIVIRKAWLNLICQRVICGFLYYEQEDPLMPIDCKIYSCVLSSWTKVPIILITIMKVVSNSKELPKLGWQTFVFQSAIPLSLKSPFGPHYDHEFPVINLF